MKFLCVPCDSPMKLQTVGPPERGSLSIVYSCPECGYEMAMLTNAYETQVVQSLGVRIGPEGDQQASGSGCPFTAMIPGNGEAQPGKTGEVLGKAWKNPLPHISHLTKEQQVEAEDENVRRSVKYAKTVLNL